MLCRCLACLLCGAEAGRLVAPADGPPGARAWLEVSPACPAGPRMRDGRLVGPRCGGSLHLDAAETELRETQRAYPPERRGRPPGRAPGEPGRAPNEPGRTG